MLTIEKTTEIMKKMMASFQYRPCEKECNEMINTYHQSFKSAGITFEKLIDAGGRLIFNWKPEYGRKFPAVKDFIDTAGLSVDQIAKKAHDWFRRAILTKSSDEIIDIGQEHRHAVAMEVARRLGGWVAISHNGVYDWDRKRDKFIQIFSDIYYQPVEKKPLLGISDLKNKEFLAESGLVINFSPSPDKLTDKNKSVLEVS